MIETASESDGTGEAWDAPPPDMAGGADALIVDVAGFEGPLDLLLALARTQKVDITKVSIVGLVDQYLAFIGDQHRLRIEVAADYLVMAAWLAYLKSRLLLPRETPVGGEPTADELAQRLAFRLMRLDAMRRALAELMTRKRLGRDVFGRGMPEAITSVRETEWSAEVYDLLKAYAELRRRTAKVTHVVKARKVWSIKDARTRLEQLIGTAIGDWLELDSFIARYIPVSYEGRTAIASSFGATLEMARDGMIELRQEAPFAPIYVRRRDGDQQWERIS